MVQLSGVQVLSQSSVIVNQITFYKTIRFYFLMGRRKKQSCGRYTEILPGLYVGGREALAAMEDRGISVKAVANIGGGKAAHPNTLRIHVADSEDTSLAWLNREYSFKFAHLIFSG